MKRRFFDTLGQNKESGNENVEDANERADQEDVNVEEIVKDMVEKTAAALEGETKVESAPDSEDKMDIDVDEEEEDDEGL